MTAQVLLMSCTNVLYSPSWSQWSHKQFSDFFCSSFSCCLQIVFKYMFAYRPLIVAHKEAHSQLSVLKYE